MRLRQIAIAAWLASLPFSGTAAAAINPIPLIIQNESSGNPTAQNAETTASGLFQDISSTWAEALAACNCGTTAQYPTAASAPSSVQIAANDALINQNGLSDWLCAGCDPAFAAQVAAAGGVGAFQTSGLDTNPADFASTDTAVGLADFLAANGAGATETGVDETGQPTGAIAGTGAAANAAVVGGATGGLTGGLTTPPALTTNVPDAPPPTSGVLDQIVQAFGNATSGWQAALATIATHLFWLLAAIEFFVMIIGLILQGERPNWWDVVSTIIYWLFPIGLFWWLLQNGSTYAADIINSMRQAGAAVGGDAITPSAILSAGIALVSQVWQYTHVFFHPAVLGAEMIALAVIMVCFALTAVWMAATLIEAYFIIRGLGLVFGFWRAALVASDRHQRAAVLSRDWGQAVRDGSNRGDCHELYPAVDVLDRRDRVSGPVHANGLCDLPGGAGQDRARHDAAGHPVDANVIGALQPANKPSDECGSARRWHRCGSGRFWHLGRAGIDTCRRAADRFRPAGAERYRAQPAICRGRYRSRRPRRRRRDRGASGRVRSRWARCLDSADGAECRATAPHCCSTAGKSVREQ
jgi:hypothetical protein